MAAETRHGSPLDMQLPDGGRVMVSVDLDGDHDDGAYYAVVEAVEVEVAAAIVTAGDDESDVERAVVTLVESYGLTVSTSTRQRTRRISVR